jgi:hypothetical protein
LTVYPGSKLVKTREKCGDRHGTGRNDCCLDMNPSHFSPNRSLFVRWSQKTEIYKGDAGIPRNSQVWNADRCFVSCLLRTEMEACTLWKPAHSLYYRSSIRASSFLHFFSTRPYSFPFSRRSAPARTSISQAAEPLSPSLLFGLRLRLFRCREGAARQPLHEWRPSVVCGGGFQLVARARARPEHTRAHREAVVRRAQNTRSRRKRSEAGTEQAGTEHTAAER